MGGLIITSDLMRQAGISRGKLEYMRRKFPDQVAPARVVNPKLLLWHQETVLTILAFRSAMQKHVPRPKPKTSAEDLLKLAQ
jgi:hypothetical protein